MPREFVPQLWLALVAAIVLVQVAVRAGKHPRLAKHSLALIGSAFLAGGLLFLGTVLWWLFLK